MVDCGEKATVAPLTRVAPERVLAAALKLPETKVDSGVWIDQDDEDGDVRCCGLGLVALAEGQVTIPGHAHGYAVSVGELQRVLGLSPWYRMGFDEGFAGTEQTWGSSDRNVGKEYAEEYFTGNQDGLAARALLADTLEEERFSVPYLWGFPEEDD